MLAAFSIPLRPFHEKCSVVKCLRDDRGALSNQRRGRQNVRIGCSGLECREL
jgi:hypothetical protein